ncbi:MAG: M36 family metallopeptidase [Chloroflexota bacterium]
MHVPAGKTFLFVVVLLAVTLIGLPNPAVALTDPDPSTAPLPDYDIRKAGSPALPQVVRSLAVNLPQEIALQTLMARVQGVQVRWSPFTESPGRILGMVNPLTMASADPPRTIAARFLRENRDLFMLREADIAALTFTRDFRSERTGVTHLTMQQQINGLPLFGAQLTSNIDSHGRLLSVAGELLPDPAAIANTATPDISETDAVQIAAVNANISTVKHSQQGLVYFPLARNDARLAWDVFVEDAATPNSYRILVDAQDGRVLWRQSTTFYAGPHGEVYTRESPVPNIPIGAASGEVPREDVDFNGGLFFPAGNVHFDWWNDSTSSADTTTTKSNNAHAKQDTDGDNDDTEGFPPSVTDGNFTFPIDLTQAPATYLSASTVNLFHWLNRLHDLFYGYGFDEAAGNYQSDNFGLGGVGGDPLQGDTQDPNENCNAHTGWTVSCDPNTNICTAGDGISTRIQTGICGNNDLGLENQVITHEWGHAVHARLVPSLGGSQQMGEGWADFFAIAVFAEPTDDLFGSYPIASWSFNKPLGIRRQPYSVDQTVFTRTYGNLNDATYCSTKTCSNDDTQVCDKDANCGSGNTCDRTSCKFQSECEPPVTPISQGPCIANVYHAGELWTETLWLARANLLWKHGFTIGSRSMMELVIDGMKLSPPYPDFLDMRDAILLADTTGNGGANTCLLWDGFARMGLGNSATTSGPDDINPVEAFDLPPDCTPDIRTSADLTFANLCPGQTEAHALSVANDGNGELIVRSVSRVSGSADITVAPVPQTPAIISAGTETEFSVQYAPAVCGSGTAVVRIQSNDPDQAQLDLTFSGSTDAVPPTITFCPADLTLECDQPTDPAQTGTATATDSCGTPEVTYTDLETPGTCPQQSSISRTWEATDGCLNSSSCVQTIEVVDTTPPVIHSVSASPNVLWSPNHKMVHVAVTAPATDNCDSTPVCTVTDVSSNEPVNGLGDGDASPDWVITGDLAVDLRAERSGTGEGRIYTITVTCTDACGNSSIGTTSVAVPRSQK